MNAEKLESICAAIRDGAPPRDVLALHGVDVYDLEDLEGAMEQVQNAHRTVKICLLNVLLRCATGEDLTTQQFNSAKWLLENRFGYGKDGGDYGDEGDIQPQVINITAVDTDDENEQCEHTQMGS